MSPEEFALRVLALQQMMRRGELSNTEALHHLAWISFVAQGVTHPTANQMAERMNEVVEAARFSGPNPTPEEIDAACSFISRPE